MAVVEAVASFAPATDLGRKIEAAMTAAVLQAYSQGVSDPATIRQMMQDAATQAKAAAGLS